MQGPSSPVSGAAPKTKSSSSLRRKAAASTMDMSSAAAKRALLVVAATATSNIAAPTAVLKKIGVVGPLAGLKSPAVVAPSVVKAGPLPIAAWAPEPEPAAASAAAPTTATSVAPPAPAAPRTSVQAPPVTAVGLAPCPNVNANSTSIASLLPGFSILMTGENAPSPCRPLPPVAPALAPAFRISSALEECAEGANMQGQSSPVSGAAPKTKSRSSLRRKEATLTMHLPSTGAKRALPVVATATSNVAAPTAVLKKVGVARPLARLKALPWWRLLW